MSEEIVYRAMNPGEKSEVCRLVVASFDEFIAPNYSKEGIDEFSKYAQPDQLLKRSKENHFVLVALTGDKTIGMIEVRNNDHISMLFVSKKFHRRGVGAELMRRSLEICQQEDKDLKEVNVYSSPYAVPIYEKMGFQQTEPEQIKNGIRFVPMVLSL